MYIKSAYTCCVEIQLSYKKCSSQHTYKIAINKYNRAHTIWQTLVHTHTHTHTCTHAFLLNVNTHKKNRFTHKYMEKENS